jgi:hypothetical protein
MPPKRRVSKRRISKSKRRTSKSKIRSPKRRTSKSKIRSPKRRASKSKIRSPKHRASKSKIRSPKRRISKRRIRKVESSPCSIRNKDQCHHDPNCKWVKKSGCKRNVASGKDIYEVPVYQKQHVGVVSNKLIPDDMESKHFEKLDDNEALKKIMAGMNLNENVDKELGDPKLNLLLDTNEIVRIIDKILRLRANELSEKHFNRKTLADKLSDSDYNKYKSIPSVRYFSNTNIMKAFNIVLSNKIEHYPKYMTYNPYKDIEYDEIFVNVFENMLDKENKEEEEYQRDLENEK